ncbi:MAG: hypothetical protein P4L90_26720 [Rhodopila sp.]|nr:hypothetical protein [Rhodopila sp.]
MRKLLNWLHVRDYEDAKLRSATNIVSRYARGNVAVQNGWFLNRSDLDALSASGDRALASLKKHQSA